MDKFIFYVVVIYGFVGLVQIVLYVMLYDCWIDDDVEVMCDEIEYCFDNGVIVCCLVEQDCVLFDLLCVECWIDYDVLCYFDVQLINLLWLMFDNVCCEIFWLCYYFV